MFLVMTLSTRNLLEPGSTRLVALLITIRKKPSPSSLARGRAISLINGHALRRLSEAFFLGLAGDTSSRVQRAGRSPPGVGRTSPVCLLVFLSHGRHAA